jgi:hypothetical protein
VLPAQMFGVRFFKKRAASSSSKSAQFKLNWHA